TLIQAAALGDFLACEHGSARTRRPPNERFEHVTLLLADSRQLLGFDALTRREDDEAGALQVIHVELVTAAQEAELLPVPDAIRLLTGEAGDFVDGHVGAK